MNSIGKISIILPCYKAERFVVDMVRDVQAQTYTNWELIVVSNGAAQEAQLTVLEQFKDDDRIKILSLEEGGVSNARNAGLNLASGQWIAFVDADDRLLPAHLEQLASGVDASTDVVIAGYTVCIGGGQSPMTLPGKFTPDAGFFRRYISFRWSPWSKLIRKSVIDSAALRFNPRLTYAEDGEFCYRLFLATSRIAFVEMAGYLYNCDGDSATSRYHASFEEAHNRIFDLERRLHAKWCIDSAESEALLSRQEYLNAYFCVHNLFKPGAPRGLLCKRKNIKRIAFDNPVRRLISHQKGHERNIYTRMFDLCLRLRSPWVTTLLFQSTFFLNNLRKRLQR